MCGEQLRHLIQPWQLLQVGTIFIPILQCVDLPHPRSDSLYRIGPGLGTMKSDTRTQLFDTIVFNLFGN